LFKKYRLGKSGEISVRINSDHRGPLKRCPPNPRSCRHACHALFIVDPARGYEFNRLLITARNYHKMHNASSGFLGNKSAHNNYAEASADY